MSAAPGLVLITGMSGAGRTTALHALEDLGYEAVDNLPLALLDRVAPPPLLERAPGRPTAVGIDVRGRDFSAAALTGALEGMRALRIRVLTLFLDCDDTVLLRRYTETRRRHPLAADRPVADGLALERRAVGPVRALADAVIDTSQLTPWDLKRRVADMVGATGKSGLVVTVMSFSFRGGLPREADLVFDARFLTNPHYDPDLKPLSGLDAPVQAAIAADPDFAPFMTRIESLMALTLPRYRKEGKSYLTIAIGCTGGRHRSVHVAESLAERLREAVGRVHVIHRDIAETPAETGSAAGKGRI